MGKHNAMDEIHGLGDNSEFLGHNLGFNVSDLLKLPTPLL